VRVAVTGVGGYLGQLLAQRLADEPAVDSLLGLDVRQPAITCPKMTFQPADVRTAPFEKLLRGYDVVYHLAFVVEPRKNLTTADINAINIDGSERVARGAVAAGVPKLVVASSVAAYGAHPDNPPLLTEDAPLRPNANWYYSRTKGEVERRLDLLQKEHPETIIIRFRPSIFLGPTVKNSMAQLFRLPFLISSNRALKTEFCWDEDIVEAFRLALTYDRSDVFNLTGGQAISDIEAGAVLGKRVLHIPHRLAVGLARLSWRLGLQAREAVDWIETGASASILMSADHARECLGWQPRFDSAGALRKYVDSTRRSK